MKGNLGCFEDKKWAGVTGGEVWLVVMATKSRREEGRKLEAVREERSHSGTSCLDTHTVCWLWGCGHKRTDHLDSDVLSVCFLMVALGDIADIGPTVLQLCIVDDEDGADLVRGSRQEVSHWLHSFPCLQNGDRRHGLRSQKYVLPLGSQGERRKW